MAISIYHAGGSDLIPEMTELGDVDVALVPIGGKFTMDIDDAVEAVITINPKIAIPMHRHQSKADPIKFKDNVEAKSKIKVVPLHIGEVYSLK
jgi:L-ascorbate metabolism protein UlaG (beta-lactamase superfamily)